MSHFVKLKGYWWRFCLPFVYKGDNFGYLLLSWTPSPFWKGVYFKRKEFALKGSKFFPFRVDVRRRPKLIWQELLPLKVVAFIPTRCLKYLNNYVTMSNVVELDLFAFHVKCIFLYFYLVWLEDSRWAHNSHYFLSSFSVCIYVCVKLLKRLLQNHQASLLQVSCVASRVFGDESLFKGSWSTDENGHAHIW